MSGAAAEFLQALARKSRLARIPGFQIGVLRRALGTDSEAASLRGIPFRDYIPIRLVTIIKNAFRSCVTQLVDGPAEFKRQGVRYISNIRSKHMAEVILELDKKAFTLGEVIAKTLPCSKIEHILSPMQSIYGDSFKADLADSRERWIEDAGLYKEPFISDLEATLESIARLFTIRHILVHEIPDHGPYDPSDLPELLGHAERFVEALTWVVNHKLYGPVPRTQSQMNAVAGHRAMESAEELAKYFGEEALVTECLDDFSQHAAWNRFAHLSADAQSGMSLRRVASGSIASMLYSTALARLNEWRLADLKAHPDRFDGSTAKRPSPERAAQQGAPTPHTESRS